MENTHQKGERALQNKVAASAERTFVQGIVEDIELGLWSFELDEGVPPRMYGNVTMDGLIGCDGSKITPEEYYDTWYGRIDPSHLPAVHDVVARIIAGEFAEVYYPYHHPTRGVIQVVCGGRRDTTYTKGIRLVGRHQEITSLVKVTLEEVEKAKAKAQEARAEADRANYISDALGALAVERNFSAALLKILRQWCETLGAEWGHVGRWDEGAYHTLQGYAVDGEEILFEPDTNFEYLKTLNDSEAYHAGKDYVPMPDFREEPVFADFLRIASRPQVMMQVSSCYSHVIHRNGRPWGTIVLYFRNRRELTASDEAFFKASVRCVELSLVRQGYEEEIAADRARDIAFEQERTDKQRRINESLQVLLGESDLRKALERIMIMWCESLGAQWCYLGEYREGVYAPVYSYAVKGETPLYDEDDTAEISTALYNRGASDFLAMPDFKSHPLCAMLTAVSPHPEVMREVSSCYSHIIHNKGERWGSLVLSFREHRVLSPSEVDFFVALAKGVEVALARSFALKEIADERDRALAAEKARSLFFSSVSHDIRTPLNAIIGFSELLEAGVPEKADHDRYVSTIRSSGKVLARLVNDILDLSKLESGKLEILHEPTDVPALTREVIDAFAVARSRKSIIFTSQIASMPTVSVDPQRIRQILYNLLSNAHKYTDAGRISLTLAWQDRKLAISVADTGKGISKEDLTRILQPFVQIADRNHRDGTGLGLSICQKLAQLMNGELTVESEVGKGSTFTITLHDVEVVSAEAGTAAPEAQEPLAPANRLPRTARVLIVDDSAVNRAVLKAMLVKNGVTDVITAENGEDALDKLMSDRKIGAVLTDLWMPVVDGEGLVKAIRADETLKDLPVYLITADVESVKANAESGFTGILLKPITQAVVRSLLD